jgi:hypothetical protein
MMLGVHGGEEVSGGFMLGLFLPAAPVHAQAVAEPANHAHHQHRMGVTDAAEVVQMRHV